MLPEIKLKDYICNFVKIRAAQCTKSQLTTICYLWQLTIVRSKAESDKYLSLRSSYIPKKKIPLCNFFQTLTNRSSSNFFKVIDVNWWLIVNSLWWIYFFIWLHLVLVKCHCYLDNFRMNDFISGNLCLILWLNDWMHERLIEFMYKRLNVWSNGKKT